MTGIDYFIFQQIHLVKSLFSFLVALDIDIFNRVNNLAGYQTYLDVLGKFFASYLIYILIGLTLVFLWKNRRAVFLSFLAGVLARFGLVELVRFFWPRVRPFVENSVNLLIKESSSSSFPSGHAAFSFALSFVVYQYNKKAGALFFVASFLIAVSRVFVGIHWPSDVLAGAVVGIFSGWLLMKVLRKLEKSAVGEQ
ncbi:MAG: phosphatase PAP2 family protein [Candidatus Nealsonbacteria bacterium]|nr:phosphatase PAP2 family protein [Candidatus Nealsonbacteria bacterium]